LGKPEEKKMTVHYTVWNEAGDVVEASEEGNPLTIQVGADELIDGFEKAISGLGVGEEAEFVMPPEDGYGPRDESRVEKRPLPNLSEDQKPVAGNFYVLQTQAGNTEQFKVLEVGDDFYVADLNHPLAGQTLKYHVKVLAVEHA